MLTFLLILVIIALVVSPALFKQNQQQLAVARVGLSLVALTLLVLRFTTCANDRVPYGMESANRYWAVGWKLGTLVSQNNPDGGRVFLLLPTPKSPGMQTLNEHEIAVASRVHRRLNGRPGLAGHVQGVSRRRATHRFLSRAGQIGRSPPRE